MYDYHTPSSSRNKETRNGDFNSIDPLSKFKMTYEHDGEGESGKRGSTTSTKGGDCEVVGDWEEMMGSSSNIGRFRFFQKDSEDKKVNPIDVLLDKKQEKGSYQEVEFSFQKANQLSGQREVNIVKNHKNDGIEKGLVYPDDHNDRIHGSTDPYHDGREGWEDEKGIKIERKNNNGMRKQSKQGKNGQLNAPSKQVSTKSKLKGNSKTNKDHSDEIMDDGNSEQEVKEEKTMSQRAKERSDRRFNRNFKRESHFSNKEYAEEVIVVNNLNDGVGEKPPHKTKKVSVPTSNVTSQQITKPRVSFAATPLEKVEPKSIQNNEKEQAFPRSNSKGVVPLRLLHEPAPPQNPERSSSKKITLFPPEQKRIQDPKTGVPSTFKPPTKMKEPPKKNSKHNGSSAEKESTAQQLKFSTDVFAQEPNQFVPFVQNPNAEFPKDTNLSDITQLKVFYWNPNSVHSPKPENSYRKKEIITGGDPDIILMCEPYHNYEIPGYTTISGLPLKDKSKLYSCIIFKSYLQCRVVVRDVDLVVVSLEGVLEAPVYFFSVYLSHTETRRLRCLELAQSTIAQSKGCHPLCKIVFVGDLNKDLLSISPRTSNAGDKILNQIYRQNKFLLAIDMHHNTVTRERIILNGHTVERSRIDYMLFSKGLNVKSEAVKNSVIVSDHYAFNYVLYLK